MARMALMEHQDILLHAWMGLMLRLYFEQLVIERQIPLRWQRAFIVEGCLPAPNSFHSTPVLLEPCERMQKHSQFKLVHRLFQKV